MKNNHIMKNCTSFGAFYRDNTDFGFNFIISRDVYGDEIFEFYYTQVHTLARLMLIDKTIDKKILIKDLTEQIQTILPKFYRIFFNTDRYPQKSIYNNIELDFNRKMFPNLTVGQAILVFISNVLILQELKAIPNDDFNGMNYMYLYENNIRIAA